eukprot:symbB.v1.2.009527.t1/scaffold576.1/size184938/1
MFILNVDPRCRVTPEWFFARAATLTTLWILIFGMYVVDYKWKILPTVWAEEGYNKRASFHFVFYPVVLLLLTIVGSLAPSTICRNRPREALPSIGRSPQKTDKDLSQNLLRDGHRHSVPNLANRPKSSSRPATSASTRGFNQSSFAKQCRKMASKETIPVIKFDEAFDMAYRLAVKRVANDRKQVQVSLHKNASQTFSEVLGGKNSKTPFVRSKECSQWAIDIMRKLGEKLSAEEVQADKSRRRSSIKESFASFGDVERR